MHANQDIKLAAGEDLNVEIVGADGAVTRVRFDGRNELIWISNTDAKTLSVMPDGMSAIKVARVPA